MHWRSQGDLGELSAMEWFASKGASICVPVGHSPNWDFIAVLEERLLRVQVKTCTFWRNDRWCVQLSTRGGNRSWTGTVKRLTAERCDCVLVVVRDGRRWCIPASALGGGSSINLGGPRYAEFEVESGPPLPRPTGEEPASTIGPLATRGDVRAAKGDAL
jgi:PD-(D/E)XK endonuclease